MPLPLTLEALAAVRAPLASARMFPREAYTSLGVLALERRALFGPDWYAAASECDVARPGAWARVPLYEDSLVVTRDADLSVRAVHDVCSHRALQLLEGPAGHLPSLHVECPYHRWRYDLRGTLRRAPGMPDSFDCAHHGLRSSAVSSHFGQLFVTPDAATHTPLASSELPPWLAALDAGLLRRARRVQWETRANWKLVVENFQESHHFPTIHPGLERLTAARESSSVTDTNGRWLGGVMRLADGAETVSLSGRVGRRAFLVPSGEPRRLVYDALVLPNLMTSLQPDYLLTYRLHPRSVDCTEVVAEIFVHAATPLDEETMGDVYAFWDRTNAEDRAVCERQQRGLASSAWAPGPYAPSEDGMHAFDALVARRLEAALRAESR